MPQYALDDFIAIYFKNLETSLKNDLNPRILLHATLAIFLGQKDWDGPVMVFYFVLQTATFFYEAVDLCKRDI